MPGKKISMRRCVGCRQSDVKGGLTRLVLRDGVVSDDPFQRGGSRGAYLHRNIDCIGRAGKEVKRWEYAFRVARGAVQKNTLEAVLEGLRLRSVRKEDHVEDTNL